MIHLVHGFNVSDGGKETTDKLRPYFESAGFEVTDHDYGWIGLLGVRFLNGRIAKGIREKVKAGDIGVGHSNGCAILARACEQGAPFKGLVLINPALNSDTVIPGVEWVHVYHTNHDSPVKLASWLPFHQWGDMGAEGFRGQDVRYTNFNLTDHIQGHSEIFQRLDVWGQVIVGNTLFGRKAGS